MKIRTSGIVVCLILPLLAACSFLPAQAQQPTVVPSPVPTENANMANPASVNCEQQGGTLDIRTAADGSQQGFCVFSDGSECDEWAFFRGECAPGGESLNMPNPASAYCQQQGGTVDIRTASDGSQQGFCVFSDGSECDEWAYFRGECEPGAQSAITGKGTPEAYMPDMAALQAFQYEGWLTYTNTTYGFSVRYPADWRLDEVTDAGDTMYQHRITLNNPADPKVALYIAFKGASEDRQITPTGTGAGELVSRGSVPFLGSDLGRQALVADGKDMAVYYGTGGEISSTDLAFWIALNYAGNPQTDPGLSFETETLADRIVTSLRLTP